MVEEEEIPRAIFSITPVEVWEAENLEIWAFKGFGLKWVHMRRYWAHIEHDKAIRPRIVSRLL